MTTSALLVYDRALRRLAMGEIDLAHDDFKLALFTSTSNCATRTEGVNDDYADLTGEVAGGHGYATGGLALTGVTLANIAGTWRWRCDDAALTASSGIITARYGVIHDISHPGDALIGYWLLDTTGGGQDVTCPPGADLVFLLSAIDLIQFTRTPGDMANKFALAYWNAALDALVAAVGNAGVLRLCSGTRPTHVADPITGSVLAEFVLGAPFAPAASGGVLLPTLPSATTATATGTVSHYRVLQNGGTTAVFDGNIGGIGSGADMEINDVDIAIGASVEVANWQIADGGH